MYSLRGTVQCISLVLFLTQPIFGDIIRFNDGEISYEYDNSSTPLGRGFYGKVFAGIRTNGNHTESVAFKELTGEHESLAKESNICEIVGHHESFPTFYRYFPKTNETKAVFVMERIGKTLDELWAEYRPFSPITVMQIGLRMLDALEWMHSNGITHNDLHWNNVAVGYHNKSEIYLFDFSLAEMNNKTAWDLYRASQTLNLIIRSNSLHEPYECNKALEDFDVIVNEFRDTNTSDNTLRSETIGKLRSILTAECESHGNDADYGKYADIGNIQDADHGVNLLRILIKQNDTAAIKNLLQFDQELNVNAGFGNSSYYKPIHLAAELGNASVVQLLIEQGAEIDFQYNETHSTLSPLHYAAMEGNTNVVQLLCDRGAEVNAKLLDGRTPLHFSVCNGHADVVRILCECGADINARDNDERTPLRIAVSSGKFDVAQILSEHDADI